MAIKVKACEFCTNEFAYDTNKIRGRRYCSPLCRNRAAQRKREEKSSQPRRCPRCGETKDHDQYASVTAPYCRPCMADYARGQRTQWTPEQRLNHSIYERAYRNGITAEALRGLFASQDGRCAVCQDDLGGPAGAWHVDHDHACCPDVYSGKGKDRRIKKRGCGLCVRGLLCNGCNVMLGMAREDPAILKSAIAYLERSTS